MPLNVETSENAKYDFLKTHYYKCDYLKLKKAVIEVCESLDFDLTHEDDDYFELLEQRNDVNLTIKFNEFNKRETSLDIFVDAYYVFMKKTKVEKLLRTIYVNLNKKVEFKGLGLHPEVLK